MLRHSFTTIIVKTRQSNLTSLSRDLVALTSLDHGVRQKLTIPQTIIRRKYTCMTKRGLYTFLIAFITCAPNQEIMHLTLQRSQLHNLISSIFEGFRAKVYKITSS